MSDATDERIEAVARDLDAAAEAIADVAMDLLRSALQSLDTGAGEAPAKVATARSGEAQLNRARAAVEKAARLLRQTADGRARRCSADGG